MTSTPTTPTSTQKAPKASSLPNPPGFETFSLSELASFTREGEGTIPATASHWLFYVGRDDVHGVLMNLFQRISLSLYMNMFGYDDSDLNNLVMRAAEDADITVLITLDQSQAGSVHEKQILASNIATDPTAFNSHFVIGTSPTRQITHTKGGVLDNVVGFEGSTNWSTSGEGTFVTGFNAPGGPGYKAQNNTLMVFTDIATCTRFQAELVAEHLAVQHVGKELQAAAPPSGST